GALVAVLRARAVVPGAGVARIAARLGELVAAHVGDGGEALRLPGHGRLRIAAGVAVEVPEEGELHVDAAAGAGAVPGAVAGVAARQVGVDGVVAVARGIGAGDHLADLGEDGRGAAAARRGAGVHEVAQVGRRGAHLAVAPRVLVRGLGV